MPFEKALPCPVGGGTGPASAMTQDLAAGTLTHDPGDGTGPQTFNICALANAGGCIGGGGGDGPTSSFVIDATAGTITHNAGDGSADVVADICALANAGGCIGGGGSVTSAMSEDTTAGTLTHNPGDGTGPQTFDICALAVAGGCVATLDVGTAADGTFDGTFTFNGGPGETDVVVDICAIIADACGGGGGGGDTDELVVNSQSNYTHTAVDGTAVDICVPNPDFYATPNDNCPSDGHVLDASCSVGATAYAWEYSDDGGASWTGIGGGAMVENVTETECGGIVRLTITDECGNDWCTTKCVDAACCTAFEGEELNESFGNQGDCFVVPPGTGCASVYGGLSSINNPNDPPPERPRPMLTLDNTDMNCPSKFTFRIEALTQRWAEPSAGQNPRLDPEGGAVQQLRMAPCDDEWLDTKWLGMFNFNDPDGAANFTSPANNTCDRFSVEDCFCEADSRVERTSDAAPPGFHLVVRYAHSLIEGCVVVPACASMDFCLDVYLYWENGMGASGGPDGNWERIHTAVGAKVMREACK